MRDDQATGRDATRLGRGRARHERRRHLGSRSRPRCRSIASVLQAGRTRAGALALLRADGAEDVGRGRALIVAAPTGLVPRRAQRRAILFFWPTRASSANQSSMRPGSTPFCRAISSRRAGELFKVLDRRFGLGMVTRRAESLR